MTPNNVDAFQLLWGAATLLALANAAVCIAVARSGYFSRSQVTAQTVLVWLIPVLGAVLVGIFLRTQRSSGARRTPSDPMEVAGLGDGALDGGHAP